MIATLNSVSECAEAVAAKRRSQNEVGQRWNGHSSGKDGCLSPVRPEFRERLRPLISMWLDMLVLRLMNQGKPGVRPVWFILDELQSLHALPQLHTAITESRKARNPVVLGLSRTQPA